MSSTRNNNLRDMSASMAARQQKPVKNDDDYVWDHVAGLWHFLKRRNPERAKAMIRKLLNEEAKAA